MARPLCTLIHISDPHFGPVFENEDDTSWTEYLAGIPGLALLQGLLPHDYQVACNLAQAIRTIRIYLEDEKIPCVVVHTGDLTATGSKREFVVGGTFLYSGHVIGMRRDTLRPIYAGLMLDHSNDRPFDIPGNHDLWSRGSPKDHTAFTHHYGGVYPRVRRVEIEGKTVILYGLDSNRSTYMNHFLANGEIAPEAIQSLLADLKQGRADRAIQVVCLHHPLFECEAGQTNGQLQTLTLKNRESIAKALAEAGADLVLAGHVHSQTWTNRSPGMPLHFVAGSACQKGAQRPSFWKLDVFPDSVHYTYFHMPETAYDFRISASGKAEF